MFGELVGLWLADIWIRSGRKDHPLYVELGPGRGTLAADALRAMQMAALTPKVHFVETSEALRAKQKANVPDAARSEEHTSELQSLMRSSYAVFCLQKTNVIDNTNIHN